MYTLELKYSTGENKKENTVQEEAFKKNQGLLKELVKKKTNVTFDVKCCWQPLIPVLWTHHGLYHKSIGV